MNVLHDLFQSGLNRKATSKKSLHKKTQAAGRAAGQAGTRAGKQQGAKNLETAKSYKVTGKKKRKNKAKTN